MSVRNRRDFDPPRRVHAQQHLCILTLRTVGTRAIGLADVPDAQALMPRVAIRRIQQCSLPPRLVYAAASDDNLRIRLRDNGNPRCHRRGCGWGAQVHCVPPVDVAGDIGRTGRTGGAHCSVLVHRCTRSPLPVPRVHTAGRIHGLNSLCPNNIRDDSDRCNTGDPVQLVGRTSGRNVAGGSCHRARSHPPRCATRCSCLVGSRGRFGSLRRPGIPNDA